MVRNIPYIVNMSPLAPRPECYEPRVSGVRISPCAPTSGFTCIFLHLSDTFRQSKAVSACLHRTHRCHAMRGETLPVVLANYALGK